MFNQQELGMRVAHLGGTSSDLCDLLCSTDEFPQEPLEDKSSMAPVSLYS